MGWVIMSEREINRIEIVAQTDDSMLSVETGARYFVFYSAIEQEAFWHSDTRPAVMPPTIVSIPRCATMRCLLSRQASPTLARRWQARC